MNPGPGARWIGRASRQLRFDPAPEREPAGRWPAHGLPELFRDLIGQALRERTPSARHEPPGACLWAGWWHSGHEFRAQPAELAAVSPGAAVMRVASPLPMLREVWICRGLPRGLDDCVLATVLDVVPLPPDRWLARVELAEPSARETLATPAAGQGSEPCEPSAHERS